MALMIHAKSLTVIEGARTRLQALRRKVYAAQQSSSKRSSHGGSGNVTPKPTSYPSPAMTPSMAGSTTPAAR